LRRNCHLKRAIEENIEGKIEVTGRQGRRHEQLLDDFKEKGGYWKLKKEALYHAVWRGYGPVVKETTEWMNEQNGLSTPIHYRLHQATSSLDIHYSIRSDIVKLKILNLS